MLSFQTEDEWRIIFLVTAGVYAAGRNILAINLYSCTLLPTCLRKTSFNITLTVFTKPVLAGAILYGLLASGERQSWAEPQERLIEAEKVRALDRYSIKNTVHK
jgi:hypothetical protein